MVLSLREDESDDGVEKEGLIKLPPPFPSLRAVSIHLSVITPPFSLLPPSLLPSSPSLSLSLSLSNSIA